eukprot:Plantae.Rhodophyta-Purpureofilum_apyrenoidigerum.ctg3698.p1 GENE.Plantae.Rhodophyta-Purpureofilum_apyrenoidigerum.ctg3698~~Plantae.Rhodophyta-Purpureofilum_apyrenoidigerum.ctg3698.p1  ORF type:complete len:235 (+),score=24.39 Plantae.Rhodophyta-Purpureofilum_apyrenoidigerum.ctg3698:294-998(+)
MRIIQIDALPADEDRLWRAVLDWGMVRCNIESHLIQRWNPEQKLLLRSELQNFMLPGALRLFDITPQVFLEEMEPADVVSESERLLKLRFEAIVSAHIARGHSHNNAVTDALRQSQHLLREPAGLDFSVRFRRRPQIFESLHPHLPGASEELTIEMQPWCKRTVVLFDQRTELAQGAELTFYVNNEPRHCFSSFFQKTSRKFLVIEARKFVCIFRSDFNHVPRWGYQFLCIPGC